MTEAEVLTFDSYEHSQYMRQKGGWTFARVFHDNVQVGSIQQKSGRLVPESGWHVTPENAAMIHAKVVQHGTCADRRVLTPESGLDLKQAKAHIQSAWDREREYSLRRRAGG